MEEVLGFIFEGIIVAIGYLTYGTDDKPGHVFWRYLFRTVVFGGSLLALVCLFWPSVGWVPIWVWVAWSLSVIGIAAIEHEFGSTKITALMLGCFVTLIVTFLFVYFVILN